MLAFAVNQANAQNLISDRSSPGSGWARQVAGECATNGGFWAKVRGFKVERLALFGQHRFNVSQGRACTYGHYQLYGMVIHYACVLAHVEGAGICTGLPADEGFGVAAHYVELLPASAGLEHLLLQLLRDISHVVRLPYVRACVVCIRATDIPDSTSAQAQLCPD